MELKPCTCVLDADCPYKAWQGDKWYCTHPDHKEAGTRPAARVDELIAAYEAYIKVIEDGYGEILDTLPVDVDELAPSIKGERDNANKRIAKARAALG